MLSAQDVLIMQARKKAAISALKFFDDVKNVISPNLPGFESYQVMADPIINAYRDEHPVSVIASFSDAVSTGYGNCCEQVGIVYASLSGNPRIIHNSVVAQCELASDHEMIIVTDPYAPMSFMGWRKLNELSRTTMVVDPWTRDYYFPNIDLIPEYLYDLGTTAALTSWQREIRAECIRASIRLYHRRSILALPKKPKVWETGKYSVKYTKEIWGDDPNE